MISRFVIRVIAFFSLPTALIAAWIGCVVAMDRRSYRASLLVPEGRDVWICGDSQARDGFDPRVCGRLHNFSCAAAAADQNWLRLKDLLSANPGRKGYVLLDATPVQVGLDERRSPLSESGPGRVHALLHFYHMGDSERPLGSVALLVRDVLLVRKFNEIRKSVLKGRPYVSSLVGGFFSRPTVGFVEHPERAKMDLLSKANTFNETPRFTSNDRFAEILVGEAEDVRKVGMTPVFISTPISPMLIEAFDKERLSAFTNGIADVARRCGAPYINFVARSFPLECWHDANHLNLDGAERFTREFMSEFARLEDFR